jgi:hypothetical protein
MKEQFEKLLERYYEKDFYDYREDLMDDIVDLDECAQEVALEARVSKMVPLIDLIRHQLENNYPNLTVEEIVSALKYLLDGELGESVIIYGDDILENGEYLKEIELVGEKINYWIQQYAEHKKVDFEIVEIIFVFDQLIRGFRGSDEKDQFILIPEYEYEEDQD